MVLNAKIGVIVFFGFFVFFTTVVVVYHERSRRRGARRLRLLRAENALRRHREEGESRTREKPGFWDLWTQRAVGGEEKLMWDQIVPLAAHVEHEHPPSSPPHTAPVDVSAPAQPSETGETGASVLRVAVTIAMPSPSFHKNESTHGHNSDPQDAEGDGEASMEYYIGLAEVPWAEGDELLS